MIDPVQFRDLIVIPTLEFMEKSFPGASNPAAVHLLIGTAYHESLGGTYLKQISGPALGIYQIEPTTHEDLFKNYLPYDRDRFNWVSETQPWIESIGIDLDALIWDMRYATIIARLLYYRKNFEWPEIGDTPYLAELDYIKELGAIWKEHFNTVHGAGTVNQFVDHFPREVLGESE